MTECLDSITQWIYCCCCFSSCHIFFEIYLSSDTLSVFKGRTLAFCLKNAFYNLVVNSIWSNSSISRTASRNIYIFLKCTKRDLVGSVALFLLTSFVIYLFEMQSRTFFFYLFFSFHSALTRSDLWFTL